VGALNKLEKWVKCKQNDRLCLRLPCTFLFERQSIFYYFSNLTLEFWLQFKSRHSWDLNVFSSDPSYILKHFFGMSVLVVMNPPSLFKGWKLPSVYSSNSPDQCLPKKSFKTSPITKTQHQTQYLSWFCWTFQKCKSLCLYYFIWE